MIDERAEFLQLLRKGVSFMMNRELAKGVVGVMASVVEALNRQQLMRRAISRMVNAGLGRGFGAWLAKTEEAARAMESLRRSMGHAMNRGLSKGWTQWYALTVGANSVARLKLGEGRRPQVLCVAPAAVWVGDVAEVQHRAPPPQGLHGRGRRALVPEGADHAFLRRWHDDWLYAKLQGPIEERVRAFVMRSRGELTAMAFMQWSGVLGENSRKQRLMQRAIAMFIDAASARAILVWATMARVQKRLGAFTVHGQITRVWKRWAKEMLGGNQLYKAQRALILFVVPRRLEQVLRRWADHSRMVRLKRKGLARLIHVNEARALSSWVDLCQRRHDNEEMRLQVAQMWADFKDARGCRRLALYKWTRIEEELARARRAGGARAARRLPERELAQGVERVGCDGRRGARGEGVDAQVAAPPPQPPPLDGVRTVGDPDGRRQPEGQAMGRGRRYFMNRGSPRAGSASTSS